MKIVLLIALFSLPVLRRQQNRVLLKKKKGSGISVKTRGWDQEGLKMLNDFQLNSQLKALNEPANRKKVGTKRNIDIKIKFLFQMPRFLNVKLLVV